MVFSVFRKNKVGIELEEEIGFESSFEELKDYVKAADKLNICFKIEKKNIGSNDNPVWVYYFSLVL